MNLKNFLISLFVLLSTSVFADTLTLNSLDKDGVNTLFKGNTLTVGPGVYVKDKFTPNTIKIFFAEDGTLKGKMTNAAKGTSPTDTGTWTVKDDGSFCTTWKNWGDFCQYIYQLKDHYIIVTTDQNKVVVISKDKISKGQS